MATEGERIFCAQPGRKRSVDYAAPKRVQRETTLAAPEETCRGAWSVETHAVRSEDRVCAQDAAMIFLLRHAIR